MTDTCLFLSPQSCNPHPPQCVDGQSTGFITAFDNETHLKYVYTISNTDLMHSYIWTSIYRLSDSVKIQNIHLADLHISQPCSFMWMLPYMNTINLFGLCCILDLRIICCNSETSSFFRNQMVLIYLNILLPSSDQGCVSQNSQEVSILQTYY